MKISYVVYKTNKFYSMLNKKMYVKKVVSYKRNLFSYTFSIENAHRYSSNKNAEKPASIINGTIEII